MDALDALDAVGESNVQLVRQVGSDQWDGATPCTEWDVRSLVGHLIMGRLLVQLVADCVVHSWDLATALGVDRGSMSSSSSSAMSSTCR